MKPEETAPPPLPTLHEALLDSPVLDQLFRDIETCTEVLEVIPKAAARSYVPETSVTLEAGRSLLRAGNLRALQIRYRYDGSEWWDTLMHNGGKVRLVRIQHSFDGL